MYKLILTPSAIRNCTSLMYDFDYRSPTRSRTTAPQTGRFLTCRRPLCPSVPPGDVTTSLPSGNLTTTLPHPLKVYPSCDLAYGLFPYNNQQLGGVNTRNYYNVGRGRGSKPTRHDTTTIQLMNL